MAKKPHVDFATTIFFRQIWTLVDKTLRIALYRNALTTVVRAFVAPIAFMIFLTYARILFTPPSMYGIGAPAAVRNLTDAVLSDTTGRHKIVFCNNGLSGGAIDHVIQTVAKPLQDAHVDVAILSDPSEVSFICPSNLKGLTRCFGAVTFESSPSEGWGAGWYYFLQGDAVLGERLDMTNSNNDAEKYVLPLQRAVEHTIASLNRTHGHSLLNVKTYELPYTSQTQEQRKQQLRIGYMGSVSSFMAIGFVIGMIGVVYHQVGFMASERESGMSQLIDAMMPNPRRWQPQAARLAAQHLAFDIVYFPGWLVMACVLAYGLFPETNAAIVVIYHLLYGFALLSFSIFSASFFKRAQLSGISATIIFLVLAIVAQVSVSKSHSAGTIAILGLLFPPMNYVFFIILMARWERQSLGANLLKQAPHNPWDLPGLALWIFLVIQIFAFPVLAALVERTLHGTASQGRNLVSGNGDNDEKAVHLDSFCLYYRPNRVSRWFLTLFRRKYTTVKAVDHLSLTALPSQILVLLGANGSGKSTTLDTIAGLNRVTSGRVSVNSSGGLGICPQRNVLWPELTVEEHVYFFNRLKSTQGLDSKDQIKRLITACDLGLKSKARSKTLSGGQKRKLQLSMMLTGGSKVCLVDEVSSGVDPLSRRKIWDILLAERGSRSIILTTHFLDEADVLSDHIAILAKGVLKAQGSAVELKQRLGDGYKVYVYDSHKPFTHSLSNVKRKILHDRSVYTLCNSADASSFINALEHSDIQDYDVNGPTIEDVFLKIAGQDHEFQSNSASERSSYQSSSYVTESLYLGSEGKATTINLGNPDLQLQNGKRISMKRQFWILFRKRLTILRRNFKPHSAAFLVPIITAGLVTMFLSNYTRANCRSMNYTSLSRRSASESYLSMHKRAWVDSADENATILVGPPSALTPNVLDKIGNNESIRVVDSLNEWRRDIGRNFAGLAPGGFFLDNSTPVFAYKANGGMKNAVAVQNMFDNIVGNMSIGVQYTNFPISWQPNTQDPLQLILYFGLAMCVYPAFLALYPTMERLHNVRALHYSNGVRSLPLWLAHFGFDSILILVISAIVSILFAALYSHWFHVGYLFLIFLLYGLTSTLLSYVLSLFAPSQLAAFAFSAGGQAVMFLIYFIGYMCSLTYAPVQIVSQTVNIVHFTIAAITPSGNLMRSLLLALNLFSILCRNQEIVSYPAGITVYGGPILYLIIQGVVLFAILLRWDHGSIFARFQRPVRVEDIEEINTQDQDVINEAKRVQEADDGLRVLNLNKSFGKFAAVQNISFGVKKGEVFALLGPNGAGKTTTISMIRGDIRPSHHGDVFIDNISLNKHLVLARQRLGVCPQFDAIDQMTVCEHLRFYARIRGVADVERNVQEIMRAVGISQFSNRMAAKLSGGNKRKLSLGIALMGNPSVVLLDEPSSGMDAASKRVMWETLSSVIPGRSIILTTHSMEEADALANRAGIMARKMLALGTADELRRRYGSSYYVHLVTKSAPHTDPEEMQYIKTWIYEYFPGAEVEDRTFHGQVRFSVPAMSTGTEYLVARKGQDDVVEYQAPMACKVSALFALLEASKDMLGLAYYSVSRTSLDEVFLAIVGKHNVEEEGQGPEEDKKRWYKAIWK
ncbi:P-loop containing nucleoside triphosphate hydrolase protein [Xylona heveae TC161]|uniref:p-loop containing nucleoside triphosphate hydrolase protein n=1 Tax=Xylona heveae (strain CBS 132557 / TC161) TaxID=1328760 RepID=A0A165AFF6_XYLHT|nr:P-loop containing nucleoside triphosphate hydrolase protein [Xylona heveae TC161]KZF20389.1 P-loop containing nucleoside triphosphate hydrolase protein [Xylona heveae TC161]